MFLERLCFLAALGSLPQLACAVDACADGTCKPNGAGADLDIDLQQDEGCLLQQHYQLQARIKAHINVGADSVGKMKHNSTADAEEEQEKKKPHILFILMDDHGWNDIGWHNGNATPFTSKLTRLAHEEGMILDRHYVFFACSPSRRSFLTGRNVVHHGIINSGASDDIDLRWTWLSTKLASAGYTNYWYGKGHTGYKSTMHLPTANNFFDHYGFLTGEQPYQDGDRWSNAMPAPNSSTYSTDAYGAAALRVVQTHNSANPLFLYLSWQAVHTPYDLPVQSSLGACPTNSNSTILQLMCVADAWTDKIVQALKDRGMWNNTLVVYSSDNGGTEDGNNYPLRGEKDTDFDGGFRANAFIAGGLLPKELHGTVNKALVHITDWYPTLCHLAGVDPTDDPPVPPLPFDPDHPDVDIWGDKSYPGIDGVNMWDALMTPNADFNAGRKEVVLSPNAMIAGRYKLVTGQSHDYGSPHTGWRMENGTWVTPSASAWSCAQILALSKVPPTPCLFDILQDPEERYDLAKEQPELVQSMVRSLQLAWAANFTARSPKQMIGPCNINCAAAYYGYPQPGSSKDPEKEKCFPYCGVPGCPVGDDADGAEMIPFFCRSF
mmetsp:Transcript_56028/g.97788  ORF Transcript_56028/g.97788 Transcript_56028/m.97788 type:complete len:607 (+) Transcript_56028:71-1891(+)